MFRMCASNSHSYTHLILALGIVRKPTVWVFITSQYPGIHDIGLPGNTTPSVTRCTSEGLFHANLSVTTQNWPFSVLGFWDKNTGICAGAMPYRPGFSGPYQDLGISS